MRTQSSFLVEGHILEGQQLSKQGHEVRVTVLQGGQSKNGFVYDQGSLQQLARLIEGAQAYADHNTSVPVRSVRDIVGFYKNATYIAPDDLSDPQEHNRRNGRVDATLHILEAADWLWSIIYEAASIGRPELIGLSVDIFGQWTQDNGQAKYVTGISQINSCDIVTRPSAGGAFQRILHFDPVETQTGPGKARWESGSGAAGTHCKTPQFQEGDTSDMNANIDFSSSEGGAAEAAALTRPAVVVPPATAIHDGQIIEQQLAPEMRAALDALALERAQLQLERRLLDSVLPQAVLAPIVERYAGRVFEMAELERDLSASQSMLATLAAQGMIRDHGYEKPQVGQQITEAEKVQAAFDLMFGLEVDANKFGGITAFRSIREAYARATGDPAVSGAGATNLGQIRVSEYAPVGRISEADTTTASFSYLLGTSMNKRLLKDYQAWPAEWQRFCTVAPIKDFKQQSRVRLGAFGSLSTVAEDTAYSTITLTDSSATYVPTKRGNLVTVSRETIVNDDLMAIKQIPTKLAVAAAYTLAEFVYSFFSSNPNIYDSNPLFTNGAPHSNLGTAALSTAAMQTGVTAMREQTNFAGKRIGLRPRYLVVPPELEFVAMVVTKSAGVPGSNNNDINPMLGYVTPIVSPQLASATQWFFVADPLIVDTIEIGFVGGQVNPALFIQDQPLFGLNFTQDVISYKIRHEYGGAVVDYRGLYRGI